MDFLGLSTANLGGLQVVRMILIWVRDWAEEPLGSMHELAPSLVKYEVLKLYNKPLLHTSSMIEVTKDNREENVSNKDPPRR